MGDIFENISICIVIKYIDTLKISNIDIFHLILLVYRYFFNLSFISNYYINYNIDIKVTI